MLLSLLSLVVSLWARVAHAEPAHVVLVHWQAQEGVVTEAITRIRGELVADGFDVSVIDAPTGAGPQDVLARVARSKGSTITLGLFLQADAKSAELWVVDRLTDKTVVRRVRISEGTASSVPEVLARRSVELLRASLLEILVDAPRRSEMPADSRQSAASWAARDVELPSKHSWGAELGIQALAAPGGVGAAVMPIARLRASLGRRTSARLSLSGLGSRPRIDTESGSATLSQELVLLELLADLFPQPWLIPHLSLGAGAYRVALVGNASSPYVGLRAERVVFAADAGVGLALPLASSIALNFEAHGLLVAPYPVIRFLGVEKARVGNPLASGQVSIVGLL